MRTLATALAVGLTALAFSAMSDDDSFFQKAGQAGLAEVEAGRVAALKGTSNEVREFGAMMVEQHGAANRKLAAIARAKGVALPTAPSPAQTDALKRLQAKDGAGFDQDYLAAQVRAHEEAVALLKSEIVSGQDATMKAFARELLPQVESHLQMAYHLTGRDEQAAAVPQPEQ
jgi:putative membrane protein